MRRTGGLLLVLLLCVAVLCLTVGTACANVVDSGDCGNGVTYTIETGTDGYTLKISGNGSMADYNNNTHAPWYNYAGEIKSIQINEGVINIGDYAFCGCNLENGIQIPNSVKKIEPYAFKECSGLTGIKLPKRLTKLGFGAFRTCNNLAEITIPDGITQIEGFTFYECKNLKSISLPSSLTIINKNAFCLCTSLTEITIPVGTKEIEDWAFGGCFSLTRVNLPSSLEKLYDLIFAYCNNLTDVYYDGTETQWNSVEKYDNWKANAPDFTVHLRCQVTYNANGHGTAPEPLKAWTDEPMADPGELTAEGWTFTGWYKEAACINKWNFTADTVSGDMTLYAGWEKVPDPPVNPDPNPDPPINPDPDPNPPDPDPNPPADSWTAPDGSVYKINGGSATFSKAKASAKEVTIPATITANGQTYKVTAIADKACYKLKKLQKVTIGKNVKTVGKSAFEGCAKLKAVKGGAGIVTIKDKAFKGCKVLAAFTFNSKVTKIGKSAFEGCKKLMTITFKTAKLKKAGIGKNSFKGIYATPTVKCPKKQLKNYKAWLLKVGKMPSKAKFK